MLLPLSTRSSARPGGRIARSGATIRSRGRSTRQEAAEMPSTAGPKAAFPRRGPTISPKSASAAARPRRSAAPNACPGRRRRFRPSGRAVGHAL